MRQIFTQFGSNLWIWSLFIGAFSLLLLWGAARALEWAWLGPRRLEKALRNQGLSGTMYRSLVGDLKENSRLNKEAYAKPMPLSHDIIPRVAPLLHRSMKEFGKQSFTWFGPLPRVTIRDPELVKEILSNKFRHFQKIKVRRLGRLLVDGLSRYEGEKWVKHRRILNPAFYLEKLKVLFPIKRNYLLMIENSSFNQHCLTPYCTCGNKTGPMSEDSISVCSGSGIAERMLPAFSTCCDELVDRWENSVGPAGSFEVDVWPELQNLTGDVISRAAFGSSYLEGRRIFQLQSELAERLIKDLPTLFLPFSWYLPTENNKRMKQISREVETLLMGIISKRKKARNEDTTKDDLLDLLLESNMREMEQNGKFDSSLGMTTLEVIKECKVFYFAGQETTSVLLTWTMVVLSMHPEWQEKAREEVLQHFGKKKPDFDDLSRLKIVMMILYEVLRLYSPVVILTRQTYKTMQLGNLTIPPGVLLGMPIMFIHHDPDIWGPDATEFKPTRFADGISKATKDGQLAFFPFGWGPRICIGQNFALLEAKMGLSMILQHFKFELSEKYQHAPYTVVTVRPQYGAPIKFHMI